MNYKNLVFLGTSHIAKQSLDEVKNAIEKEKPEIIALELDHKRLHALMQEQRRLEIGMIRKVGIKGFIFLLIGAWAEKKLGKLVGVAPGSEMRQALKIARKKDIRVALVDQDIEITLKRLSHELTWKEKWNFVKDVAKAFFSSKKEIDFDLRTVPDKKTIKKLVDKLRERYPNVYKVLIEERNIAIANNLRKIIGHNTDKKILVILGAGHIEDVVKLLEGKEIHITYSFSAIQNQ